MHELEWNRALLTMTLISGIDVSTLAFKPREDILNIHRGIINYNKLNSNLLINETFVSDCR